MIISTDNENVVIGKIYRDILLYDGQSQDQIITFMVMREATYEEYLEYCTETGAVNPSARDSKYKKFYEISTD